MTEISEKKKKNRIFLWLMLLYVTLWAVAIVFATNWVWEKAWSYQNGYDAAKQASQPEVYMDELIKEINAEKLVEWLGENTTFTASEYTSIDEYQKYFENIIKDKEITYEKTDAKSVYNIKVGRKTIASVRIASDNRFDKYNFSGWKFLSADVMPYIYDAFNKTIIADKNYDVYVNGKLLTEDYIVKEKGPELGSYMTEITGEEYGADIYKVDGFLVEPEIYAVDSEGNRIENTSEAMDLAEFVEKEEVVMDEALKQRVSETLLVYFEHLNKLKTFEDMKEYLLYGTNVYKLIEEAQRSMEWTTPAVSISVEEQVIGDYVKYSETYFSCNVYLNVLKNYGYTTKNEYFDAVVLFRKEGDQWYWDSFKLN